MPETGSVIVIVPAEVVVLASTVILYGRMPTDEALLAYRPWLARHDTKSVSSWIGCWLYRFAILLGYWRFASYRRFVLYTVNKFILQDINHYGVFRG